MQGCADESVLFLCRNGKVMSTGAPRVLSARLSMLKVQRRLLQQRLLPSCCTKLLKFKVANILGAYSIGSPLCMRAVAALLQQHKLQVDVDPQRFPGARVKIPIPSENSKEGAEVSRFFVKCTPWHLRPPTQRVVARENKFGGAGVRGRRCCLRRAKALLRLRAAPGLLRAPRGPHSETPPKQALQEALRETPGCLLQHVEAKL